MDFSKLGRGQQIATVGGIVLFVALFLPWFSAPVGSASASAWEIYDITDLLLAATAVLAIVAGLQAMGMLSLPTNLSGIVLPVAGAMTLWSLYRLVNQPGPNDFINNGWAAYVGFIAIVAIVYGSMTAQGETAPAAPAAPPAAPPPAPPAV